MALTDAGKNQIIAGAVGKAWGWETGCGPGAMTENHSGIPIDFAHPVYTLKLIEWAAKQGWWAQAGCLKSSTLSPAVMVMCRLVCLTTAANKSTAAEAATAVRDYIAEALISP